MVFSLAFPIIPGLYRCVSCTSKYYSSTAVNVFLPCWCLHKNVNELPESIAVAVLSMQWREFEIHVFTFSPRSLLTSSLFQLSRPFVLSPNRPTLNRHKKMVKILSLLNLHIIAYQFCSTPLLRMFYFKGAVVAALHKYLQCSPWSQLLCCSVLWKYVCMRHFPRGGETSVTPATPECCTAPCQLGAAALCTSTHTATLLLLMVVVFGQKRWRTSRLTLICR